MRSASLSLSLSLSEHICCLGINFLSLDLIAVEIIYRVFQKDGLVKLPQAEVKTRMDPSWVVALAS
jgi:hypothetical protein